MPDRNRLICENVGLVHSCARRFFGRGVEYDDLYQAGCVGLVKAADGFDPGRGLKFSTYAVPMILGEIKRIFRDGGALKVSRSLKELSLRIFRESEDFQKREGRSPTLTELAERTGADIDSIAEAIGAGTPPVSLTVLTEDDEGAETDIKIEPEDEKVGDLLALRQVFHELPVKDRQLIVMRFFKNNTQTQTAAQLGMSQVQVSRREKAILRELRLKLIS